MRFGGTLRESVEGREEDRCAERRKGKTHIDSHALQTVDVRKISKMSIWSEL